MKACVYAVLITLGGALFSPLAASTVVFDFENGPFHGSTPFDQSADGLNAHFAATGSGFSLQPANTMGFTPVGFSGYCIYPNSVFASDLTITFDLALTDASILYAPQELATDSSCTMRITAYSGTTYVGTNTYQIPEPGTWPTGTLSFSSATPFDKIVIHYDKPPPTGGDYGPIFMADHLVVNTVPEPRAAAGLALGAMLLATARGRPGKRDARR